MISRFPGIKRLNIQVSYDPPEKIIEEIEAIEKEILRNLDELKGML